MKYMIASVAVSCLALSTGPGVEATAQTPAWLTCPDSMETDLRQDRARDLSGIRAAMPSAGAATSDELAELARLPRAAYELYDTYDQGGDVAASFNLPGLKLVGFIYGDPGRDTERTSSPREDRGTRTFYGFVADDLISGQRVIVFRGTLQPNEWARNLQVGQRAFSSARNDALVHRGFMAIYESLELEEQGEVFAFAKELPRLTGGQDTLFVGHSLGAAIATLAGVDAAERAPQNAGQMRIVTYASPRVGNEEFVSLASSLRRVDRICNKVDIVTAVPPSTRKVSYSHLGNVFSLSSFDWPALNNDIEATGEQILCWHSDKSYAYMLGGAKDPSKLDACLK